MDSLIFSSVCAIRRVFKLMLIRLRYPSVECFVNPSQSHRDGPVGYWLGRWFCFTVELAVTTSVTITASYWLMLGGDEEYQYQFMNVHEHVMNTVLALASFLLLKRAFTWWHVIFMWIFGVFYCLQNYISYLAMPSRNNIYGLINWEDLHQEKD